jgi:hypothetical protein
MNLRDVFHERAPKSLRMTFTSLAPEIAEKKLRIAAQVLFARFPMT